MSDLNPCQKCGGRINVDTVDVTGDEWFWRCVDCLYGSLSKQTFISQAVATKEANLSVSPWRDQELYEAAQELLEVAELRGDNVLPHPCDDAKLWTARMQDAWDELECAVGHAVPELTSPWQSIATAPKDGREIQCWRDDVGEVFTMRWTSLMRELTDSQIEEYFPEYTEEQLEREAWWTDASGGEWIEGDEIPTHWAPLADPPEVG